MKPYIFGKRNTIHIIDIRETVRGLLRAKKFISQIVGRGEDVLFVGTKRQARLQVQTQAVRVGMPFVTERWLGGTLTNFRTIRSRLQTLDELEKAQADTTGKYSKKAISSRLREIRRIQRNLEGIRGMSRLPGALIVIDVHREHNAVREAKKLAIPTVCLIDTDSDPDFADIPIPGNDDAIRAIDTVLTHLADAVEEGKKARSLPTADSGEGTAGPRKRSRRATTARAEDAGERSASDDGRADSVPAEASAASRTQARADAELTSASDRSA
jgi:small subunit ribosomal protein S2